MKRHRGNEVRKKLGFARASSPLPATSPAIYPRIPRSTTNLRFSAGAGFLYGWLFLRPMQSVAGGRVNHRKPRHKLGRNWRSQRVVHRLSKPLHRLRRYRRRRLAPAIKAVPRPFDEDELGMVEAGRVHSFALSARHPGIGRPVNQQDRRLGLRRLPAADWPGRDRTPPPAPLG